MSKYTWEDMEVCKECHFADKDPDICLAFGKPVGKPCKMNDWNDECGRFVRNSKWDRMPESERNKLLDDFNNNH